MLSAKKLAVALVIAPMAACSLTSLSGFSGGEDPAVDAAGDATMGTDGASTIDSATLPEVGADGDAGPCGAGAVFCSSFPGPAFAEWSRELEYGGDLELAQDFVVSAPNALKVTTPALGPGGTGGGAELIAVLPASAAHVTDELSFAFRHDGLPAADITLAKLTLGAEPNNLVVLLNAAAGKLVTKVAFDKGTLTAIGGEVPLPAANVWTQVTLRVVREDVPKITLELDGAPAISKQPGPSGAYGTEVLVELGLLFVPDNTPAAKVWFDDVAIRRR